MESADFKEFKDQLVRVAEGPRAMALMGFLIRDVTTLFGFMEIVLDDIEELEEGPARDERRNGWEAALGYMVTPPFCNKFRDKSR